MAKSTQETSFNLKLFCHYSPHSLKVKYLTVRWLSQCRSSQTAIGQVGDKPLDKHAPGMRRFKENEKPQSEPYLLGENFKRLYRVAHCKSKQIFLSYVFSLTVAVLVSLHVSARVCMCVCKCFQACMRIRVIRKRKRVQWVIDK